MRMLSGIVLFKMPAQGREVFLHPYFELAHLLNLLAQGFQVSLPLAKVLFEMKELTAVVLDLFTQTVLQIECAGHVLDVSALQHFRRYVVLIGFLASMRVEFLLVHDIAIYLQVFGSLYALGMVTLHMVYLLPVLLVDDGMVEY